MGTRLKVGPRSLFDWCRESGELLGLVDWLSAWEVSHVAMESTGEY